MTDKRIYIDNDFLEDGFDVGDIVQEKESQELFILIEEDFLEVYYKRADYELYGVELSSGAIKGFCKSDVILVSNCDIHASF